MSLYSVVLFMHVGAALVLAAALGIDVLLFTKLQTSSERSARQLLDLWTTVPAAASTSGAILLLSGFYLTARMSAWSLGWPEAAIAALILVGLLGGITGRRMRQLRHLLAADEENQTGIVKGRGLFILDLSLITRIALFLAAALLMTAKPGVWQSVSIVGTALLLGIIFTLLMLRSGRALPSSATGS